MKLMWKSMSNLSELFLLSFLLLFIEKTLYMIEQKRDARQILAFMDHKNCKVLIWRCEFLSIEF